MTGTLPDTVTRAWFLSADGCLEIETRSQTRRATPSETWKQLRAVIHEQHLAAAEEATRTGQTITSVRIHAWRWNVSALIHALSSLFECARGEAISFPVTSDQVSVEYHDGSAAAQDADETRTHSSSPASDGTESSGNERTTTLPIRTNPNDGQSGPILTMLEPRRAVADVAPVPSTPPAWVLTIDLRKPGLSLAAGSRALKLRAAADEQLSWGLRAAADRRMDITTIAIIALKHDQWRLLGALRSHREIREKFGLPWPFAFGGITLVDSSEETVSDTVRKGRSVGSADAARTRQESGAGSNPEPAALEPPAHGYFGPSEATDTAGIT